MMFRFLPIVLLASNAFAVSPNSQCKIANNRVIEIFSLQATFGGQAIPQVLDIQLDQSIRRPFDDPRGFQECARRGVIQRNIIQLDNDDPEERGRYVLERAGTILFDRKTDVRYKCDSVPVYNSYCFCQYMEKARPDDTTCGDSGDHFNRREMLLRGIKKKDP